MKDPNIVVVKEKKNIVWIDILEDAEEVGRELSNQCTLIIVDDDYANHFIVSCLKY